MTQLEICKWYEESGLYEQTGPDLYIEDVNDAVQRGRDSVGQKGTE
ncbi:MAG TPA: hypothetical protein PLU43_10530 [Lachnospiraceae bacterium]|nr:hypothetical protein [Lachnospiraceae bacterium]